MTTCWKKNQLKIIGVIIVLISCIIAISLYSFSESSKGSRSSKSRSSDISSNSANTINSIDNKLNINNSNLNKTNINLKDNNLFSISSTTAATPSKPSNNDIITPPIIPDDDQSSSNIDLLTPDLNNFATQYVKPSKILPQPLHDDDLLYESRKNYSIHISSGDSPSEQYQHITGHFRNKSSKIWDPHPQYEIDVFGVHLHLILSQDSSFIPKDIKITHVWPNETLRVKDEHIDMEKLQGCYYKGHVRGDEKSSVAVSLCDGMTGHIRTSSGSFFITPIEKYTSENSNILHAVYREPTPEYKRHNSERDKGDHCATTTSTENVDQDDFHVGNGGGVHVRRKRSIPPNSANNEYTMEVLVAVDLSMQKYHKDSINSYVLTLMSIVSSIYADASIGNSINIAVVHILLLKHKFNLGGAHGNGLHAKYQYMMNTSWKQWHKSNRENRNRFQSNLDTSWPGVEIGVSASSMLDEFCRLKRHYTSHFHHDTALLITREQICRNPNQMKCDTLGLAELGTMCKSYSCAIAQDNGLSAAFTIAHELGHVLNMPHDDDPKCEPFSNEGKSQHIMSRMLDHNTHPWSWSKCSRHFVTEFLEKDHGKCMLNKPEHDMIEPQWPNSQLAGEKFTNDKQCELVFGPSSRICSYMPVCSRLWCSQDNNEQDGCRTQHMPWADGTTCDNDKWCQKGECVERNRTALKPIDGGWGPWRSWGSCSRTCGGGIQTSTRECDLPLPSNGGKYCIGPRITYRSCNKENCKSHTHDFREEQCREFNGNNFDIQGLDSHVKWVPKYGVTATDECKLFCRVDKTTNYFQLKEKVVDGTPCTHDSFNKCVNGMCRKAGCDNELNSDAIIDKCGVCNGANNTCVDVVGSFRTSQIIGQQKTYKTIHYFDIMRIPKGASNIMIEQPGSENDNNYIALKDDQGQYLLNGKNLITQFPKSIPYAGVMVIYNGANSSIERVNTTFALKIHRELIIQILSLRPMNLHNNAELLRYSYSVSKYDSETHSNNLPRHQWHMSGWSDCDKLCMGTTFKTAHCVEMASGHKVSPNFCDDADKPEDEYKTCNSNCTVGWELNRSECSNVCGDGQRTLMYQCVLRYVRSSYSNVVEDMECAATPKPATVLEPCYGTCDYATWSYGDWEPCSHTCGGGAQKRTLTCLSSNVGYPVDKKFCKHLPHEKVIQSCKPEPCAEWAYGEESPCSVKCGEGTYTTAIVCKENNNIVNAALCQNNPRLKPIMKKCTMEPCRKKIERIAKDGTPMMNFVNPIQAVTRKYDVYMPDYRGQNTLQFERYDWRTGPWSECSVTCGPGGLRKRSVVCASVLQTVEDNYCTNTKPVDELACAEKIPCPDWNYSEWTECDDQCKRHRQVVCQNRTTTFEREMCDAAAEPPSSESCCRYRWKIEFGPCSSRCGNGYRTGESLKCVLIKPKSKSNKHPVKNAPKLDDRYCSHLRKPAFLKRKKPCKIACVAASWTASDWTTCPAGCGTGIQIRNVTCMANGKVVSPKECDAKRRPSKTQSCDSTRHCHWRTTPWRECNCNGFRKRRVDCIDKLIGKETNRCDDRTRPHNSEKCVAPKNCSCKQIKEMTSARRDGEYTLFIKGKNVSVYCHNMSSANPLEYVTLKAGLYQNHASYSKKRSKNPSTCPGSPDDEMDEPSSQYGKTVFHKIRIVLQSLRVMDGDFTFANSEGIPQSYGTAGDCYSKAEDCPQGIFRINLEGTGFKVRKNTKWETKGTNASIIYLDKLKPPFKKISARCGGYCGSCFPSKLTSLHLDVSG